MDGGNGQAAGKTQGTGSGQGAGPDAAAGADLASLARDWIELWQSELAALAADPETAETWARLAALWAGLAASGLAAMPRGASDEQSAGFASAGFSGAAQPPRAAAAPASPDAGGAASFRLLERILDRLEAIERRLAEMEQRVGGGAGRTDPPRPRRRRR
jgi:hypothetical protein